MYQYSMEKSVSVHTFVFQNLKDNTSDALLGELLFDSSSCDLQSALRAFMIQKRLNHCQFQIYDPQENTFKIIKEPYIVNLYIGLSPTILIKYSSQEVQEEIPEIRKERNKQRTIRQVIKSIKQWRELHKDPLKKMNLQQAALCVGISKKSLDDYFCQLRLGEKYGFNFQNHLDDKIGVLRTFVKKHRSKNNQDKEVLSQKIKYQEEISKLLLKVPKNEKHPKKLKIIEEKSSKKTVPVEIIKPSHRIVSKSCESRDSNQSKISKRSKYSKEEREPSFITSVETSQQEFENQFYKCFSLIANQSQDPFVPFKESDFRARKNEIEAQHQFQW